MTASTLSRLCRIGALTLLAGGIALLIAGCGALPSQLPISPPSAGESITGHVHGGQQSVSGSHIYLYAAGTGGYGGPSVSLLNPTAPGVATDANGSYVTTDSAGNFSLNGTYSCSPGQQVYILARGGNPGLAAGTNNSTIALISALGNCPNAGNLAATVPVVTINEVSTIASVYALAGFMTDPTHLSSSGTQLARAGSSQRLPLCLQPLQRLQRHRRPWHYRQQRRPTPGHHQHPRQPPRHLRQLHRHHRRLHKSLRRHQKPHRNPPRRHRHRRTQHRAQPRSERRRPL